MRETLLLRAYHEYEWELLSFLGRRLGSRTLAADIAQDLYVKLLRTEEDPTVRDGRAYLFTMAANLALDHLRTEKRRGEILAEADGLVWRQAEDLTPERHVLAKAELAHVEAAIQALPERCRHVLSKPVRGPDPGRHCGAPGHWCDDGLQGFEIHPGYAGQSAAPVPRGRRRGGRAREFKKIH